MSTVNRTRATRGRHPVAPALAAALLLAGTAGPASAAPAGAPAHRVLPPGYCDPGNDNPERFVEQFSMTDPTGLHWWTMRLLCGVDTQWGLRHIDDGHAPLPPGQTLQVPELIHCVRNVATAAVPTVNPVNSNWVYTWNNTSPHADPGRRTWIVVVNPAFGTVTTAYNAGPGNEHTPFWECLL
ncbi:hypothetical protein GCM10009639_34240 [Kitasatospora putterlickiae]|uniref:Secreted protein n=1 Tax=Kitasatospora putterlickiae TaxID=221725 RepID=A0ABP4IRL3_9ACTN